MFCLAALVPSPPILVSQLCGGSARARGADPRSEPDPRDTHLAELRTAVLEVGRILAAASSRWTVVGVGDTTRIIGSDAVGTFRGFGVDVPVALSGPPPVPGASSAAGATPPDPCLPLPALIAGWLRGAVAPEAVARVHLVAADTPADRCAELGADLRAELDSAAEPDVVLVVADGAATLSTAAPGYFDPDAGPLQDRLDTALATGDRAALMALDPRLCARLVLSGRAAYQVLAGLVAADPTPPAVEGRYRGAPFGVGYHVGVWRPAIAGEVVR
ncbi:hypothetical protein [Nocardia paucivorans]|uniref:hypothetical protein n=1 Tax=Nocardia paucivorans TaxID=114259 RepID=UPI0003120A7E|nr:hypothetical protein [Nocardia paucivorans]